MNAPEYIPSARDTVIGFFGRNAAGNCRTYCARRHAACPLAAPERVWGGKPGESPETCDLCHISFETISAAVQSEHDAQQDEWARGLRVEYVLEYGVAPTVRCRVY